MTGVRRARAGELDEQHEVLVDLLGSRYARPPWGESAAEVVAEARQLAAEVGRRGVRTSVALRDGRIVGLAQGRPGQTFLDDLASALPGQSLQAWGPTAFELRQLLVSPEVEGEGVGSRLYDGLGLPFGLPALLLTHPEAAGALRLYSRRGWVHLARLDVAPGHPRLVLGLRPARPASDGGGGRRRAAPA